MDNVNNKYDNWYGLSRDPLRISISKFALISDNDIAYNYQGDGNTIEHKIDIDIATLFNPFKESILKSISTLFEEFRKENGNSWCIFTKDMFNHPALHEEFKKSISSFMNISTAYSNENDTKYINIRTNINYFPISFIGNSLCIIEINGADSEISTKDNLKNTLISNKVNEISKVFIVLYDTVANKFATPILIKFPLKELTPILNNNLSNFKLKLDKQENMAIPTTQESCGYSGIYNTNINLIYCIEDDLTLEETKTFRKNRKDFPNSSFGLPEDRKYPLYTKDGTPDKAHINSAIRLFGHCTPNKKKKLAGRIYGAMKKANMKINTNEEWYKYFSGNKTKNESVEFISDNPAYDAYCESVQLYADKKEIDEENAINDLNFASKKLSEFFNYEMVNVDIISKFNKGIHTEAIIAKGIPGITHESGLFIDSHLEKPKHKFSDDFINHLKNTCDLISNESGIINHFEIKNGPDFQIKAILNI